MDIDREALEQFRQNMSELELDESDGIELINFDVKSLTLMLRERFDTVILNPPFGTKDNSGVDILFLQTAVHFSTNAVYSMHKTSTRPYIIRKAESWNMTVQVLAQMKFEILNQFRFHKKERVFIDVDLIRLEHKVKDRRR